MMTKNTYILAFVAITVLGLVFLSWQSGHISSDSDSWMAPEIHASTATPSPTAGWWTTPFSQPVVPTMPGRQTLKTPTPTPTSTPENP